MRKEIVNFQLARSSISSTTAKYRDEAPFEEFNDRFFVFERRFISVMPFESPKQRDIKNLKDLSRAWCETTVLSRENSEITQDMFIDDVIGILREP
jgi:hypothetical protein